MRFNAGSGMLFDERGNETAWGRIQAELTHFINQPLKASEKLTGRDGGGI